MRDYAKVAPQFWTGPTGKKFRDMGRDVQTVAFYLITCPSANMIGLYYLPLPTLCHEIGISLQGASKALQSLSEAHFAYYDEHTEVVWVLEMARFQIAAELDPKDKRVIGIARELLQFKKSKFFREFYNKYQHSFCLTSQGASKILGRALEGASEVHRSQEQEQEHEHEQPPIVPPRGEKKSSQAYTEGFERFWSGYPRKVGKDAAWRSWLKRRLEASTSAIVDSVNIHRTWPEWQRENGKYIPHPSTFLNEGRWKDEELAPPAARCQCGCGFELWSDAWMQQHEGGNTNTEHAFGHKTNGVTSFAAYDVDPTDPLSIDPE